MSDTLDTKAAARAHTDASLGAERASTDAEAERSAARSRRVLDDLIERDRMAVDARLLQFRDRADRIVSSGRSVSSATGSSIRMERLAIDEGMRDERAVTDGLLERERERADAAVDVERQEHLAHAARHEATRRATDDQLKAERNQTDTEVVDRDKTTDALAEESSDQRQRGDVLGVVAHELRSPLSIVVLNAELLAEDCKEPSLREAALDVVRAAARMERLLADLLDVTRIQAGSFAIAKKEHDVTALLDEMRRAYEPLFEARGLTFTVDLPPPATVASFDHDRIVQVLSNLFANAMKFTPSGGAVHLHAELREGSQIEVALRDNGPGISADALPHVFERFWQLEGATSRGLGLGLFICKRIVEVHGGRIWVESGLGNGATFRFTLPVGVSASMGPTSPSSTHA